MRWLLTIRALVGCIGIVTLVALPTLAQTGINGEIQGKVADSSGGALPGVTITLSGPSMMGYQLSPQGS